MIVQFLWSTVAIDWRLLAVRRKRCDAPKSTNTDVPAEPHAQDGASEAWWLLLASVAGKDSLFGVPYTLCIIVTVTCWTAMSIGVEALLLDDMRSP